MRALVLDHPGSFRVADVPDPTPQAGQIVVRVECCGICGTDLHILAGEFPPTPSEFACAGCPALDLVCAGPRLRSRQPEAVAS